jgi:ribose transport system ATP-binding protein
MTQRTPAQPHLAGDAAPAGATPAAVAPGAEAISASGIRKTYDSVRAVDGADFEAAFGEVHALVGENGAGKSTLIKILCGAVSPDAGRIAVRGREVTLGSTVAARRQGIGTVFQELTLMPWMTVAENLLIGEPGGGVAGLVRRRTQPERAAAIMGQYGITSIDPRELAANLSVAERQIVEIVRGVHRDPSILFLDEPTAALGEHEAEWLFGLVRKMRDDGKCIIFTSHRWREVDSLADRITVFRNGRHVATRETLDQDEAVVLMTGRTVDRAYPRPDPPRDDAPVLQVEGLVGERVRDVSLSIRPGEILGVGGLAGQGQRELFLTLFGARRATAGTTSVGGKRVQIRKPRDAIRAGVGIALVPEDRKSEGLFLPMPVRDNLSIVVLPRLARLGVVSRSRENASTRSIVQRLAIKTANPNRTPVDTLSGGNQQKVLIGRWLMADAEVVLLYDVTRGVDVATKHDIYELIVGLAREGKAVLLFSSETEEVARLSHRVIVLREGRVAAELTGEDIDAEAIVAAAVREEAR